MSHGDVQLESENFRVTQWVLQPGQEIPLHLHEHHYVVVPLVSGTLKVMPVEGDSFELPLAEGVSYERFAGAHHVVSNAGSEELRFLEVENLKTGLTD
jgi:mannose-6-phosphate isomerase-like protein (cupin superfamily)